MWRGNNVLLYFSSVVTWQFSCSIDLYEVLHTKLLCFVIHELSSICSNEKRMVCAKIAWEQLALHAAGRALQQFSYTFDLKCCNNTVVPVTPSRSRRIVGTCQGPSSKSWLVVKEEHLPKAESIFVETDIHITCTGSWHLGAALGTSEFVEEYIMQKVAACKTELERLSLIIRSEPHAAF